MKLLWLVSIYTNVNLLTDMYYKSKFIRDIFISNILLLIGRIWFHILW